jgi:hypothetical protein
MILLDTCALLYLAAAPERLSTKALEMVASRDQIIHCSPIVTAELACLQERKRIHLPQHWKTWFRTQADRNGWNIIPISLEIIEVFGSGSLYFSTKTLGSGTYFRTGKQATWEKFPIIEVAFNIDVKLF